MTSGRDDRTPAVPDLRVRLARSREAAGDRPVRTIRCPRCGFYLLDVYGYDHCVVRVKCRKCKFNEVIDTALFRTSGRRRQRREKRWHMT